MPLSSLKRANQMKRLLVLILILSSYISACAPMVTPTYKPEDVQATAVLMAFTMVAQTQTAISSPPLIPVTDTLIPSQNGTPTFPATTTSTSQLPTITPVSHSVGDCNKPLADWVGPSTTLTLANETKQNIGLSLSLGLTKNGECGYMWYSYKNPIDVSVPVGCYYAFAYVGNKNTVSGSFCINESNWSLSRQAGIDC